METQNKYTQTVHVVGQGHVQRLAQICRIAAAVVFASLRQATGGGLGKNRLPVWDKVITGLGGSRCGFRDGRRLFPVPGSLWDVSMWKNGLKRTRIGR